jgi:TRAP-type C4-dicarboxylate transport system substrate-binding protein
LQLGLLDAVWTSSSTFGSFRLYEVAKFYTSPEQYSIYFTIEPICISMKTWSKLTPAQQKILTDVGTSLEAPALEGAKAEDKRVAKLFADQGVKVEQMSLVAWQQWQKLFEESSFPKFRQEIPGGPQLLDETLSLYK